MTCSEQMTMHLNGKRHLSKEKSHILKMMKGEETNTENSKSKLCLQWTLATTLMRTFNRPTFC